MTPAERWARVPPERRKMIARALLDRLDGTSGSDVEAAADYLEAVPGFTVDLPPPPTGACSVCGATTADPCPPTCVYPPEVPLFSQSSAEAWEEAQRAVLGYYPGHDATCQKRDEPFGLARCFCGPKPPDDEAALPFGPPREDERRPLSVYVAGGSAEHHDIARYVAALNAAGLHATYDWTADVDAWLAAGKPALTAGARRRVARTCLEGVEGADVVWWVLPAAKSEGSAFEVGVALRAGKRLVVSGDRTVHGRIFPDLAAEHWATHEAGLAAIVARAGTEEP